MKYSNKDFPTDPLWIELLRQKHPFKLFMYVAIIGIVILFAFLAIGFVVTNNLKNNYLPIAFGFSSFFALVSSLCLNQASLSYKSDKPKRLNSFLVLTFMFGLAFIAAQMWGWKDLRDHSIYFSGNVNGSYLFLLSGLHLLHFFGGIIFFLFVYFKALKAYRDPVFNLIYVTDPYESMLLDLLRIYWHAIGVIWICLYGLFLMFQFLK